MKNSLVIKRVNPEEHSVLEISSSGITERNLFFKQAVISAKVPEMSIRRALDPNGAYHCTDNRFCFRTQPLNMHTGLPMHRSRHVIYQNIDFFGS